MKQNHILIIQFAKKKEEEVKKIWPALGSTKLWFYPYGASAPDNQLHEALGKCQPLQKYFDTLGIQLRRTIATDDTLADGIIEELNRRGVRPGQPTVNDRLGHTEIVGGDLALISEWDTFYGQTLPKTVEQQFKLARKYHHIRPYWPGKWVHKLTYLRGLDGLLPYAETKDQDQKQNQATAQAKNRRARRTSSS